MQTKHGASMKPPSQVPQLLSTASPVPPPLSVTKKFLQELFASPSKTGATNSQSPGKKFFDAGDESEKNVPVGIEPTDVIAAPVQPIFSPKSSPSKYDSFLNKSKVECSTDTPTKSIPVLLPLSMPPLQDTAKISVQTPETTKLTIITQIDHKRETKKDSSLSPSTSPIVDSRMTSQYSSPVVAFSTLNSPDLFCQSTSSLSSSRYSSPLEQLSAIPDSPLPPPHPLPQSISKPIPSIITHTPSSSDDTTSSIPCTPLESSYNFSSPSIISPIDSRSSSSPSSPLPLSAYTEAEKNGRSNFSPVRTLPDPCPVESAVSVSHLVKNEKILLSSAPLKLSTSVITTQNTTITSSTNRNESITPSLNNSLSKTNSPFNTFTQSSKSTTVQSGTVQSVTVQSGTAQSSTVESHLKFFNNNSGNSNNIQYTNKNNESTPTITEQQKQQQQQQQQLDLQQSQLKRSLSLITPVRHFVPPTISATNSEKNLFNNQSPPQPVSPSQRQSASYKDFLNANLTPNTNANGNVNKSVNTAINTNSNVSSLNNKNNDNSVRVQSMEQKKSWRVTKNQETTNNTSSLVGKPVTVNRSVLSRYDPNNTANGSGPPKTQ